MCRAWELTVVSNPCRSSLPALKKYIGEKHGKDLPTGWEKVLSTQLKKLVASGKLVKVISDCLNCNGC